MDTKLQITTYFIIFLIKKIELSAFLLMKYL